MVGKHPKKTASQKSPNTKSISLKGSKSKSSSNVAKMSSVQSDGPDMMHPSAVENLYFIAHDAADALTKRGFGWPNAPKRKKKGAKRGKKKK